MQLRHIGLLLVLPVAAFAVSGPLKLVADVKLSTRDMTTVIQLPPGTENVGFEVPGGEIYCVSLHALRSNGARSNVITNSELPARAQMQIGTAKTARGVFFTSVSANCRSAVGSAELRVTAGGATP